MAEWGLQVMTRPSVYIDGVSGIGIGLKIFLGKKNLSAVGKGPRE